VTELLTLSERMKVKGGADAASVPDTDLSGRRHGRSIPFAEVPLWLGTTVILDVLAWQPSYRAR
jgi:hypothetical protein